MVRHVGWRLALTYGVGEVPLYVAQVVKGFFQSEFMLQVARIDPIQTGTVFLVAQLVDTFNDPLIGRASDSTKSRFGRRRAWLMYGLLPFLLLWVALWWTPSVVDESPTASAGEHYWLYYLFIQIAFTFAYAAVSVPYNAWLPELVSSYDDRTFVSMVKRVFAMIGGGTYTFVHGMLVNAFPNSRGTGPSERKGYLISAGISGLIFTICFLIPILFVPYGPLPTPSFIGKKDSVPPTAVAAEASEPAVLEDEDEKKRKKKQEGDTAAQQTEEEEHPHDAEELGGFWDYLKSTKEIFSNRAFLVLSLAYLLSNFSLQLVQSNLLLWVQYVLRLDLPTSGGEGQEEAGGMGVSLSLLLMTTQGSGILFLFVWTWLSRRIAGLGKRICYILAVFPGCFTGIFLFWIKADPGTRGEDDVGMLVSVYALFAIAGSAIAGAFLFPWAMLPDVVQYDTYLHGKRREGSIYSWFVLLEQGGTAIAMAGSSYALGIAGYNQELGYRQPESVLLLLRWLVGPLSSIILATSIVPMLFYPITRDRQEEIARYIDERRGLLQPAPSSSSSSSS